MTPLELIPDATATEVKYDYHQHTLRAAYQRCVAVA
jgi:hypothetical protein